MKATYNKIQIEGTPKEIAEFIAIVDKPTILSQYTPCPWNGVTYSIPLDSVQCVTKEI